MNATPSGESPAVLRGTVIRAWREEAGLSQRSLAGLLDVGPSAVSMWESGRRATRSAPNLSLVQSVADKLGLSPDQGRALRDMWRAAASVTALEPRSYWAHNFQWPSGAGWVWLRCPGTQAKLAVTGWWSDPLQGDLEMEVGPGGVFVQFPKTIPNPPLEVVFGDPAGWADFGKGTVPSGVAARLGAQVLDARTLAKPVRQFEPSLPGHVFAALLKAISKFKAVVDEFGPAWDLIRPHFGIARFDRPPYPAVDSHAARTPESTGIRIDDLGWIVSQATTEPRRFRLIREARGLSREAAAALVTAMEPELPLTAPALRAYEEAGTAPAVDYAYSRLDTAYETDGRLGLDVVHDSRSSPFASGDIRFPAYWQGPVWFQARGPEEGATGLVELVWGPWSRRQYVVSGTVLTTRKATNDIPPLSYKIPPGWHARGGVGAMPAGLDVNHGWYPKDISASLGLLTSYVKAVAG